jgi:hypothetical protein
MRLLYDIHVTIHAPRDLHLTDIEGDGHEAELMAVLERAARDRVADTGVRVQVNVSK